MGVRILLKDRDRQTLFGVEVDPQRPPTVVRAPQAPDAKRQNVGDPHDTDVYRNREREVCLDWDQAFDDHDHLRRCPACGCRDLYVRKDFHQVTGLAIVLLAGVVAMVLFGMQQVFTAMIVLGLVVLLDVIIYFFTKRCLVCYRCRSEFRDTPISRHHRPWDLSIGEKYRPTGASQTMKQNESPGAMRRPGDDRP